MKNNRKEIKRNRYALLIIKILKALSFYLVCACAYKICAYDRSLFTKAMLCMGIGFTGMVCDSILDCYKPARKQHANKRAA